VVFRDFFWHGNEDVSRGYCAGGMT
jgi:hypothetical protein